MNSIIYEKWRDEQANSKFPFTDDSTLTDIAGRKLSKNLILDASVYAGGLVPVVWLSEINVEPNVITFTLTDSRGVIGVGTWSSTLATNDVLVIKNDVGRIVASFVLNLDEAYELAKIGTSYVFAKTATEMTTTCLNLFTDNTIDRDVLGELLQEQGDVYLVGATGIQLECENAFETVEGDTYSVTKVNINAVGDPLGSRASCGDSFIVPRFIKEVIFQKGTETYSCAPNNLGNVMIVSGAINDINPALRIARDAQGISIGLFGSELGRG